MIGSILFILLSVWLFLSLILYFFQGSYIYYPHKSLSVTPAAIQLDYEEVNLTTSDGVNIHGWWIPHPEPRYTLLFLHGNAGNISHRLHSIDIFHQLGLSVFIIDYRGYGNSEGAPDEQGTYLDAEAAWQYLLTRQQLQAEEIIVFGRSLGGAVASWLASKYTAAGLILESTFTSIADMGRHYYPYLPIGLINHIKYDTVKRIEQIRSPLLLVHSPDDDIVPYRFARELYDTANNPKSFLEISGNHNDGFMDSGMTYTQGLEQFIHSVQTP